MSQATPKPFARRVFSTEGGRQVVVFSQAIGDLLWVHFDGETFCVPLSEKKARSRKGHGGVEVEGEVVAPMPGRITQVLCKEGTGVVVGQTLLVMEAMKMEYNLKSAIEGKVEKVSVKIGEQVVLGQALVRVGAV